MIKDTELKKGKEIKLSTKELELNFEGIKKYHFAKFEKETGEKPFLYYFTFIGDDYENNWVILTMRNHNRKGFLATFPKNKFKYASWNKLLKLNSHLELKLESTEESDFNKDLLLLNIKILAIK